MKLLTLNLGYILSNKLKTEDNLGHKGLIQVDLEFDCCNVSLCSVCQVINPGILITL